MSAHLNVSRPTEFSRDDGSSQGPGSIRRIGLVLFDGFSLLAAGILAEALQAANDLKVENTGQVFTYRVLLVSAVGGMVACSSSLSVWTETLDGPLLDQLDALFVAGGSGVSRALADDSFIERLRKLSSENVTIMAIGSGHLLLSAAGVQQRGLLSMRHDSHQALVSALALLKKDLGSEGAMRVANHIVSGADILMDSVIDETQPTTLRDRVCASARWIAQNCAQPISVIDAARMSSMSERNFLRIFKREMGVTPLQYLLRARLDLTCRLLESTDLPVDKIARRTGLTSGERLSKLFRKELSMSPSEFRLRFQERHLRGRADL